MNLRVDLILDDERRSGSVVSIKSLGRIGSILGPVIVLALILRLVWSAHEMNVDFQAIKDDLEITKPRHAQAIELMETFKQNHAVHEELAGRAKSRLDWNNQILGFMQVVPANVQLRSLRANEKQSLINDRVPALEFTLTMNGIAVNADAEEAVKTFVEYLKSSPPFANSISNVVMDGRADASPGAATTDRIFDINCKYYTRLYK